MTLPCPGPAPISLLDIQNEFGGTYLDNTYTQIIEYYRGGSYVKNTDANKNIPTSGQISFYDFFCSSGEIIITIGSGEDIVVKSLFGSNNWASLAPKRLIVNTGAVIGASLNYRSDSRYAAMLVDGDYNGRLVIENRGYIQGGGGAGGETGAGSAGGSAAMKIYPALRSTTQTLVVQNKGSIQGGGGGGGASGTYPNFTVSASSNNYWAYSIVWESVPGRGGNGQGYKQSNTSGQASSYKNNINVSVSQQYNNISISPRQRSRVTVNISGQYNNVAIYADDGCIVTVDLSGQYNNVGVYADVGCSITVNISGQYNNIGVYSSTGCSIYSYISGLYNNIGIYGASAASARASISGINNNYGVFPSNDNSTSNNPESILIGPWGTVSDGNFIPSQYLPIYGGSGGTFGNSGSTGQNGSATNGYPGGSAGYAIRGIGNVTLENSGTISGLTGPLN